LLLNKDLNITNYKAKSNTYESALFAFLTRLLSESPNFNATEELGFTFIYIIDKLQSNVKFRPLIQSWISYEVILSSLSLALRGCKYSFDLDKRYLFKREKVIQTSQLIELPVHFEIHLSIIEILIAKNLIKLGRVVIE
jgi:hypothetical protein